MWDQREPGLFAPCAKSIVAPLRADAKAFTPDSDMIRFTPLARERAFLFLLAMLLLCWFGAWDAAAQSPPPGEPSFSERLDALGKSLNAIEKEIAASQDDATLATQRDLANKSRGDAQVLADSLGPQRAEIQRLLDALGPKPETGEPRDVAAERARLEKSLVTLDQQAQRLKLATARAEALEQRAVDALRSRVFLRLFARGPTMTSPGIWPAAGEDFSRLATGLGEALGTITLVPEDGSEQIPPVIFVLMAGVVALLLGVVVQRDLLGRLRRAYAGIEMTRSRKTIASLLVAVIRLILPLAATAIVYESLRQVVPETGVLRELLDALAIAATGGFAAFALVNAVLAPLEPRRRVIDVSDDIARAWPPIVAALAVLFVTDRAITVLSAAFLQSLETTVLLNVPVIAAASAVMIFIVRRGLDGEREWVRALRLPVQILLFLAPIAAFAGYYALSRFVVSRLIVTLATGVLLWLLYRITDEAVRSLMGVRARQAGEADGVKLADAELQAWWLSAAAGTGYVIFGITLLAFAWGASTGDLRSWAGEFLSGFDVGGVRIAPLDVLIALLVFAVGIALTRFVQRVLDTTVMPRTRLDPGAQNAVLSGFGYGGVLLSALVGVSVAGLDLTSLAIIAGALSVGIGFGLQTIVNNFISGLILLFDRPFQVGDWIVVGDSQGYVRRINVRATEIQTLENATVIIPNANLVTGEVLNWTHRDVTARLVIPVTVEFGPDPDMVRRLLVDIAFAHPEVLSVPAPHVLFTSLGGDALSFELRATIRDVRKILQVRSELNFQIEEALHGEKPFAVGEFIISGSDMGTVEHIGLETTTLRSLSGEIIVIPNRDLASARIHNYSRMQERRVVFSIGVTYGTPLDKLKRIPALIRAAIEAETQTRFDRSNFSAYGPSSLDFETVYFVLSGDYNLYTNIHEAILLRIHEMFAREAIDFAFPSQSIYVEKLPRRRSRRGGEA
ncbi:MAG: mechanosensitive ion channel [Alphaproteobacteria bacterium]|nr:mechanosensitive ion channel [Alphaproteobacteria bacterium]